MVLGFPPTGTALFSAVGFFVHGGPSSALGFVLGDATLLVAFLDVFGHPLLFVGVTRFISTGHGNLHLRLYFLLNRLIGSSFQRRKLIRVEIAGHEIGNGAYTVIAQAAAERLGEPVENVTVLIGDSDLPPAPVAGARIRPPAPVPPS
jgi:hypothetical protein